MSSIQPIEALVRRFEEQHSAYRSNTYNETQLRREFLDPLFECLGWDVSNKQGYSEVYKEVIHEDRVKIEEARKLKLRAPDYAFRIGGTRKFFVEAKKPAVNIEKDLNPAFQLRCYAWSAKLPISILTDFEEFAVYDCRVKPDKTDKPKIALIDYFNYTDYLKNWDRIVKVFSHDAVQNGSFDKYAEGLKSKRGTVEVNDAFLVEIERWRELLATNIAIHNPKLSVRALNYAVQMTIDRIIFLRICEDRGIERDRQLQDIGLGHDVYENLSYLFQRADARYNSGLFHFNKEKDESSLADSLTLGLKIEDSVLKKILANLYPPESPYVFQVIPSDILGQVYERFLGKVIQLTPSHQARVEEKPEVRKAGGVYYTPAYIVNYIVKNTVGKLLQAQTPKDIINIKILDPACGSGSFVLGAYQFLLDWHLDWYTNNNPEKWAIGKKPTIFRNDDGWHLTTTKKKEILLNHVFGVDIDAQAVEMTKLSLLLKVLEGETEETIGSQLSLWQTRVLPDLGKNIQCGNSLIGPEYYEDRQLTMNFADNEERYRVNAFDWKVAFPQVFLQGGFDAVIGNPPYVRIQTLSEWAPQEVNYFNLKYRSSGKGNYDLYGLFVEKALSLIKETGLVSFIIGSKWFHASYAEQLRELVGRNLIEIFDFKHNQVFESAFVNTCIILLGRQKQRALQYFSVDKIHGLEASVSSLADGKLTNEISSLTIGNTNLSSTPWHFSNAASQAILEKVKRNKIPLEEVCSRIFQGLKTSGDKIFLVEVIDRNDDKITIFSKQLQKSFIVESRLFKPLYRGSQTKRYSFIEENRAILFPYEGRQLILEKDLRQNYPLTYNYLLENRTVLEAREHGNLKRENWYGYGRTQALEVVALPKIITPDLARLSSFAWDKTGDAYFVGGAAGGYGLILNNGWNYQYVLGLLNSRLIDYVIKSQSTQMESGFYSFEARFIRATPIRPINLSNLADIVLQNKIVSLVEKMLSLRKQSSSTPQENEIVIREIEATNRQIDYLVYELYELTGEEIKLIEAWEKE